MQTQAHESREVVFSDPCNLPAWIAFKFHHLTRLATCYCFTTI